ncbi:MULTISPECIES: hypothetical protein [unclassified Novosphingobium]|uniref:hypothetical protein n=1 Tax=unclassified Novosphingobium TaxID=2644732 RepID=UPI0013578526|nr:MULTISPECIES: hypothetical protein [unclassified Novosphingobium]
MSARSTYSPAVLDAMFEAVEMDDVVDPVVSLPDPIPVACTQEEMRRCLSLCVQFWRAGAIRADLRELTATLLLTGDLPQDARLRYKHIRARYKHLRFALVLYGARHKAPLLFRSTVVVMGHLQDAFRNRRRAAVLGYALLLRALLTWPVWTTIQREVDAVRLDDAAGFLAFRRSEFARLKSWVQGKALTGHRFHAMRKVVSRQVSFYDTMRTLEPDDQAYRMSRFLSAINGLMGSLHDDLVEQASAGHRNYHKDDFPLPDDIRCRLEALTARYPVTATDRSAPAF